MLIEYALCVVFSLEARKDADTPSPSNPPAARVGGVTVDNMVPTLWNEADSLVSAARLRLTESQKPLIFDIKNLVDSLVPTNVIKLF